MKCPACGKELVQKTAGDIALDVCEGGCGGIWFDNFELKKMDEKHETIGEKFLDVKRDPAVSVDLKAGRKCPKCRDVVMMQHFFSVSKKVVIDECPKCAGIWLDYGELGEIRNSYNTEEDRNKAAEKYFDDLFGDKLAEMRKKSEAERERAERVARIFKFLCPSTYIPGKQKWGAF